jgi:hypothetical protein
MLHVVRRIESFVHRQPRWMRVIIVMLGLVMFVGAIVIKAGYDGINPALAVLLVAVYIVGVSVVAVVLARRSDSASVAASTTDGP